MGTSRRAFLAFAGAGAAGLGAGAAAAAVGASLPLPLMSTYVAGSDRYAAPVLIHQLGEGVVLGLRREPENNYDARAVSVWTADGQQKLGYVPRVHNQALANLMDAGLVTEARVTEIKGPPCRPDIALAVTVVVPG